jgi:hypothetical protein
MAVPAPAPIPERVKASPRAERANHPALPQVGFSLNAL